MNLDEPHHFRSANFRIGMLDKIESPVSRRTLQIWREYGSSPNNASEEEHRQRQLHQFACCKLMQLAINFRSIFMTIIDC